MPVSSTLSDDSIPSLPRHVRFRRDEARDRWVLLAPERTLVPDEVAATILQYVDGETSVAGIVDALAEEYDAPRTTIRSDVLALLQSLAGKGFLDA